MGENVVPEIITAAGPFMPISPPSRAKRACAGAMLALMLASFTTTHAQQAPASADETFRVTTHMVLIDTVVVDRAGKPVTGLSAKDFVVLEDGKPQAISAFSFHETSVTGKQPAPALPPHVATNRPDVTHPEGAPTTAVLLLDGLNTPPEGQVYVK